MSHKFNNAKRVIANRLFSYMATTNTSAASLAKKSKISRTAIYLLLNCESNPSLSTLLKLESTIDRKLTLSI